MEKRNIAKLLFAILICQLAGVVGSIFTFPSIQTWFALIQKPWFMPPNWVFAPAWILLYFLMGIAAYLIWEKGLEKPGVKIALSIFGIQLLLNAAWSFIFFGLRQPFYAFIEIILLWVAIAATIIKFYPISKKAAILLLPYIAWVSFAAVLNFSVWMLNA